MLFPVPSLFCVFLVCGAFRELIHPVSYFMLRQIICFSVLPKISPFDFGEAAIFAGEAAQVACFVTEGDQPIDISWSFNGSDASTLHGVSTTKIGRKASTMVIDPALSGHRGNYTCTASNRAGFVNFTATLNVNGTLQLVK